MSLQRLKIRKGVALIVFVLSANLIFGQEKATKFDYRVGLGATFFSSGDRVVPNLENEVNMKLSDYFATSASVSFGRAEGGHHKSTSFGKGNVNIFLSPFTNTHKRDFRIGGGICYHSISKLSEGASRYHEGIGLVEDGPKYEHRKSFGYNITIENTWDLSDRYLFGAKVYYEHYFKVDVNYGVMFKVGIRL